jgi:hypothetical protein
MTCLLRKGKKLRLFIDIQGVNQNILHFIQQLVHRCPPEGFKPETHEEYYTFSWMRETKAWYNTEDGEIHFSVDLVHYEKHQTDVESRTVKARMFYGHMSIKDYYRPEWSD